MARGRHGRRSTLGSWLRREQRPARTAVPGWREVHAAALVTAHRDLGELEAEVVRLRESCALSTAGAVMAELRAQRLERELADTRAALTALTADVAALREELLWAFAEGKQAVGWPADRPVVIDLTRPASATA